jgi:hypothetical protein
VKAPAQLPDEARSFAHFDATAEEWDAAYEQPTVHGHWWRTRLDAVVRLLGVARPGGPSDRGDFAEYSAPSVWYWHALAGRLAARAPGNPSIGRDCP